MISYKKIMNPELFLDQRDVTPLTLALNRFATRVNDGSDRLDVLESAGVDSAFYSQLRLGKESQKFAQALVAGFRNYPISHQKANYHPMVSLLKYLCDFAESYKLTDQDISLFTRLVEQGEENCKALAARNTVARIESPTGIAIGTGVLIQHNLLLTCAHIFSKSQVKEGWVRFNYTDGNYCLDSDVFELDLQNLVSYSTQLDYVLVRVKGEPKQQTAIPINSLLDEGQEIRLIHHPQGQRIVISNVGQIVQVGEDYIDHNISTNEGSSGAPVFNHNWQIVAIHRGDIRLESGRTIEAGVMSGVPIRAFWQDIPSHIS